MSNDWSKATDWGTVCKRAGGRKGYNARRGLMRFLRQMKVAKLICEYGLIGKHGHNHGVYARMARELGVSKSTITRDVQDLLDRHRWCPTCGLLVPRECLERQRRP